MRYLITGSSGFIGQCLSNSLRRNGHTTIGVDLIPSQYTDFTIDIRNFESLQHALSNYHFDCCFHLAARTDLLGRPFLITQQILRALSTYVSFHITYP